MNTRRVRVVGNPVSGKEVIGDSFFLSVVMCEFYNCFHICNMGWRHWNCFIFREHNFICVGGASRGADSCKFGDIIFLMYSYFSDPIVCELGFKPNKYILMS